MVKKFKRGEIREDGKVFRGYEGNYERWVTKKQFLRFKNLQKLNKKKHFKHDPKKSGKKIINPKTGKPWIPGEIRKDGYVFYKYDHTIKHINGFMKHRFKSPDSLLKDGIRRTLYRIKKNFKTKLDQKYLEKIFPKSYVCPALKLKMSWLGNQDNSPSLDKIVPEKGYIHGNVVWISFKANRIKSNANFSEILKIGNWLKKSVGK